MTGFRLVFARGGIGFKCDTKIARSRMIKIIRKGLKDAGLNRGDYSIKEFDVVRDGRGIYRKVK